MANNQTSDYETEILACVPRLRRYARALCRNNSIAADDLVQECLMQGLSKFEQWQKNSNLRAWLFAIMHNLFLNQLRKYKTESGSRIDTNTDTSVYINNNNDYEFSDIEQALEKLAPDQQAILLLITLEGMSYQEIASLLDVPVGTVMSRLSRARQRLRNLISSSQSDNIRHIK